jgi:two-component system, sensor histidine kinase and response regulator
MDNTCITQIINNWKEEMEESLESSIALCVALFSVDGTLIFASKAMKLLLRSDPVKSFVNPSFEKLVLSESSHSKIYTGYITLGDFESVNATIYGNVYRKNDHLLIVAGVDANQLTEQNRIMHQLNKEIITLQRELIKEKKSLENALEKLDKANQDLQETNNAKDKFFSILAHDLKNAFLGIMGYSELLADKLQSSEDEKSKEYSQRIHSSTQNTFGLLSKLLEWAKIQQGRIVCNPELLDIGEILNSTLELYQQASDSKEIIVNNHVKDHALVYADKHMVNLIIRNLYSNALKFTHIKGMITVRCKKNDNFLEISFQDDGIGMSTETLQSLFLLGSKGPKMVRGTKGEIGTGLGLLLCKEFVEKHGGVIKVESTLGKGSIFSFTLPVFSPGNK